MAGESRKWMILVATIWIQAFTGTNFDFSAYSSTMKSVLGITQVQLNYLAVASDLGKAFGWSSGLASNCLPLWVVMFISAFMGLLGYGLQWLVIRNVVAFPYFVVFLLCLLSGCSICWFNTVCFILCNRNFPSNRPLAISLTVGFNGVSAALYALAATAINDSSSTPPLYLLLNSLIPLITSLFALVPILRQPQLSPQLPAVDAVRRDSLIFLLLNLIAVVTGLYLLLLPASTSATNSRLLFSGALFLLILPLFIPGIIYARNWFRHAVHSHIQRSSGFLLVDVEDLELHKELISHETNSLRSGNTGDAAGENRGGITILNRVIPWAGGVLGTDSIVMLGEEHDIGMLLRRLDFWLYFLAYFCGGTIGLVYSNSLGQIAQSLAQGSETSTLITLYSSFSFFGRLLSAAPDFMRAKVYFARTGWVAIALIPTPIALFMLAASAGTAGALHAGTALIGLSSGFIFAAAVSVTSELFGPNSVGVNHNILITNIPIGSLVYGLLASIIYDANAAPSGMVSTTDTVVCMGRQCYFLTFLGWGCISIVGLASTVLLFFRTRPAYDQYEKNRSSTQLY